MLDQQFNKLLLKRALPMMRFLVFNIFRDSGTI